MVAFRVAVLPKAGGLPCNARMGRIYRSTAHIGYELAFVVITKCVGISREKVRKDVVLASYASIRELLSSSSAKGGRKVASRSTTGRGGRKNLPFCCSGVQAMTGG